MTHRVARKTTEAHLCFGIIVLVFPFLVRVQAHYAIHDVRLGVKGFVLF